MKQLPVFKKLVQEAAGGNDENEDIAKGLARVFAEVAEAYVSLISAGKRHLNRSSPLLGIPRPSWPCLWARIEEVQPP